MEARLGGVQENDLFQSTIVRLVEQDCAAMKRFSGRSEDEWLAYLAVITRSVVRDWMRQQRRLKRPGGAKVVAMPLRRARRMALRREETEHLAIERVLLARELRDLCKQAIHSFEVEFFTRNMLIFRLYFDHDLSIGQIANCRGVNLSKTGVAKVINRLKEHIRGMVAADAPRAMIQ
jgi:RNA polymerase sigma factor (sigma-70 family)